MGLGRQPAGQVEGSPQEGTWSSKGTKGLDAGEEPQHHQSRTKGAPWNGTFIIGDLVGSTRRTRNVGLIK
jgi:hypothetical protein